MKSVLDDGVETMSLTNSEAPIDTDKYDLQFDVKEEERVLEKIKGLNFYLTFINILYTCLYTYNEQLK